MALLDQSPWELWTPSLLVGHQRLRRPGQHPRLGRTRATWTSTRTWAGTRATRNQRLHQPGPAPAPPGPAPAPPETITSQTVAVTPGARTCTKIGVGEEVTLTHAPGAAAERPIW